MEIRITNEAYLKLRYYVEECPVEISGLGKVREIDEPVEVDYYDHAVQDYSKGYHTVEKETQKVLEIYDIVVLPQEAGPAHATIDEEALAKFSYQAQQSGDKMEDYKVWWHSHADMKAFFSQIDTGTIETSTEFPYLISIVANKRGDMKCRLDFHKPLRVTFDDIELQVEDGVDEELRKQCRKDIERHIRIKKPAHVFGLQPKSKKGQKTIEDEIEEDFLRYEGRRGGW